MRLYVTSSEALRARHEIGCYERENARGRRPRFPARAALHWVEGALVYSAVLLFFFAAQRRHALSIDWDRGRCERRPHSRRGVVANDHRPSSARRSSPPDGQSGVRRGHRPARGKAPRLRSCVARHSPGRSLRQRARRARAPRRPDRDRRLDRLFGALGILSGYARRSRVVPWRGGLRRWAPIGAGIMLLAFLGFGGERTDVGAHVAGFAVGVVIGFALAHAAGRVPQPPRAVGLWGAGGRPVLPRMAGRPACLRVGRTDRELMASVAPSAVRSVRTTSKPQYRSFSCPLGATGGASGSSARDRAEQQAQTDGTQVTAVARAHRHGRTASPCLNGPSRCSAGRDTSATSLRPGSVRCRDRPKSMRRRAPRYLVASVRLGSGIWVDSAKAPSKPPVLSKRSMEPASATVCVRSVQAQVARAPCRCRPGDRPARTACPWSRAWPKLLRRLQRHRPQRPAAASFRQRRTAA